MHNVKEVYMQVAHRVLQYLEGILEKMVLFKLNGRLVVEAYTYAYYTGSIVDRILTFG